MGSSREGERLGHGEGHFVALLLVNTQQQLAIAGMETYIFSMGCLGSRSCGRARFYRLSAASALVPRPPRARAWQELLWNF